MSDCIFCKIANNDIACHKIFENESFLAFLDNRPFVEGHTLIIPKEHYRWIYDVPNFSQMWDFTHKVTKLIKQSLNPEFITYLTMGNEVPHAHIHLIPRYSGDQLTDLFLEEYRLSPSIEDFNLTISKIKNYDQ
jgi:histidine triad (HIT) family protein